MESHSESEGYKHTHQHEETWKLNVQGVLVVSHHPEIVVRTAITEAGFDPLQDWQIFLKVEGHPKQEVSLDTKIDLRTPGIEKLRLVPKTVNNGDQEGPPRRAFSLLPVDETFLSRLGLRRETIIEGQRRWLVVYRFPLPIGYTESHSTLAFEVPDTYPGAQIYGFYFYPPLCLTTGRAIESTQMRATLLNKEFHGWSRRRGDRAWTPSIDNVTTQIGLVEGSICKAVET
jgi:Prokaryotic E2 family E